MGYPLTQVLSSCIFKQIASMFHNDTLETAPQLQSPVSDPPKSIQMDHGLASYVESPSSGRNEPSLEAQSHHGSKTSVKPESSSDPLYDDDSNPPFDTSSIDPPHHDFYGTRQQEDKTEPPSLNGRYLKIYSYQGDHNERTAGLALTDTFVWQLNAIFGGETKIRRYLEAIKRNEAQQANLKAMRITFHRLLEASTTDKEKASNLQRLREIEELIAEAKNNYDVIQERIAASRKRMQDSQDWMYRDLKQVLDRNNLLEEVPESNDGHDKDAAMEGAQHNTRGESLLLTPREAVERAGVANQASAEDLIRDKIIAMQDARHNVDSWNHYYEDEYRQYLEWKAQGRITITKSEFDVMLLREQQAATGNLIRAEKEVEEAKMHAREIGVVFGPNDQESNFFGYHDDEYRESMEADIVGAVDRAFIERWMAEQDTRPEPSSDRDEWDTKSVDLCDSVSAIADGKERVRIDRWQEMCELMQVEAALIPSLSDSETVVVAPSQSRKLRRDRRSV